MSCPVVSCMDARDFLIFFVMVGWKGRMLSRMEWWTLVVC